MKTSLTVAVLVTLAVCCAATPGARNKRWWWDSYSAAELKCQGCERAKNLISSVAKSSGLVKGILQFANDQVCNTSLAGQFNATCSTLVYGYGDVLYYRTVDYFLSNNLCKDIGFCPNDTSAAGRLLRTLERGLFSSFNVRQLCEPCKDSVAGAKISATLRAVSLCNATAQRYCNDLPEELIKTCHTFMTDAAPLLIERLLRFLNPESICQNVRLCEQPQLTELATPMQPQLVPIGQGDTTTVDSQPKK